MRIQETYLIVKAFQESFIDNYSNLTVKSMMMLKWFSQNCENTKYLLKTDDDMYINLSVLHQVVTSHDISHEGSDLLVGSLVCSALPIRDPGHKWYMSPDIWPQWLYPPYVQGASYLMSGSAALKMYRASMATPLNHIEDVYITGILARKTNIRLA